MRIPLPTPIDRSLLNVIGRPSDAPRQPGRDAFGEHMAKVAAPERSRTTAIERTTPTPSARDEHSSTSSTSSRQQGDRAEARPAERDQNLDARSDDSTSTFDSMPSEQPIAVDAVPDTVSTGVDAAPSTDPAGFARVAIEGSVSNAVNVTTPAGQADSEAMRTMVSTAATPATALVTTASLDDGSDSGMTLPAQRSTSSAPRTADQATPGAEEGGNGARLPNVGSPDRRLDASRVASEAIHNSATSSRADTSNRDASFTQPAVSSEGASAHAQANRAQKPHLLVAPYGAESMHSTAAGVRAAHVDAAVRLANATAAPGDAGPLVPGTSIANPIRLAGPSDIATVLTLGDSAGGSNGHHSDRAATSTMTGDTGAFAARLVRGLHAMIGHRGGVMTMRLDPPSLGELRIQVSIVDGAVSARFEAATEQAHALLKQNLGALRSALEGQGLSAERMVVQHAPNTDSSAHGRFADQQSDRDSRDTADGQSRGRQDHEHSPRDKQSRREQRPAFTLDAVNSSAEPRRRGTLLQEATR